MSDSPTSYVVYRDKKGTKTYKDASGNTFKEEKKVVIGGKTYTQTTTTTNNYNPEQTYYTYDDEKQQTRQLTPLEAHAAVTKTGLAPATDVKTGQTVYYTLNQATTTKSVDTSNFQRNINTTPQNPVTATVISSLRADKVERESLSSPVFKPLTSEHKEAEKAVTYSLLTTKNISEGGFKAIAETKAGRETLAKYSDLKGEAKEIFINTSDKLSIKGVVARAKENRAFLKEQRENLGSTTWLKTKVSEPSGFYKLLALSNPKNILLTKQYEAEKSLNEATRRNESLKELWETDLKQQIRGAGIALSESAISSANIIGRQISNVTNKELPTIKTPNPIDKPDLKTTRRGLAMIGYSGASLIANIHPASRAGAEVVDVGLALPDYARAIINPTPYNKAVGVVELIDVGVDFLPLPTPNVRVNTRARTAAEVSDYARRVGIISSYWDSKVEGSFKGGGYSSDNNYNKGKGGTGGTGGIYSVIVPIVPPSTFGGFETGANIGTDFNTNINVDSFDANFTNTNTNVNADFPTNFNINTDLNTNINNKTNLVTNWVELIGGSNTRSGSNSRTTSLAGSTSTAVSDAISGSTSAITSIAGSTSTAVNTAVAINANANTNANTAFNINTNFNTNQNIHINNKLRTKEIPDNKSIYSAFARIKGKFQPIGTPTKDKKAAFLQGLAYVETTPARTFGVSKGITGNAKGLDFSAPKGFKKKKGSKGVLFIEPSKQAINTFGELTGITYKSKTKRWKL